MQHGGFQQPPSPDVALGLPPPVLCSPQRGLLFQKHRDHFGKNSDTLVVQAATRIFNPTIPEAVIAAAQADDPESALAEWEGQFRSDLSSFVDRAVVELCIYSGVHERPYFRQHKYTAFVDASGG